MKLTGSMEYDSSAEMMFGTACRPVKTRSGLVIGSGHVIPEVISHPRPGTERTLHDLLREFERISDDTLERCVQVGHPSVVIENEHVFQMTQNPRWGGDIAAQTAGQLEEYRQKYGLACAYRATIADIRKPDLVDMRRSDRTDAILESFEVCAPHADIISVESLGGKEISDYSLIRNDITGMLFAQAILGGRDMEWLWPQIVAIAKKHGCLAGGDTNCSQANVAMFMAGGFLSNEIPHTMAALCRAIGATKTLIAYECGATGPGKDCAYENPIIKAITGIPISTEGKSSACAHMSLCGNVMAAVCDLWANEAVEYHWMFGGSSSAVFAEILGYDAAAMNTALELGYQKEFQACLIYSDRYRSPQSYILCPDTAFEIGKAIVENNESYYSRAKAAAIRCGELLQNDTKLFFTAFEKDSLNGYMRDLRNLPDTEEEFIELCLDRYARVRGFSPASYDL
ncbi:MAG: hypothetical protein JXA44_08770 [Methanospirillaceae archaeon]|nr:hypothetical protein [Methanospirillaceae archaeon]